MNGLGRAHCGSFAVHKASPSYTQRTNQIRALFFFFRVLSVLSLVYISRNTQNAVRRHNNQ